MKVSTAFQKPDLDMAAIASQAGMSDKELKPFFTESGLTDKGWELLAQCDLSTQAAVMWNVQTGLASRAASDRDDTGPRAQAQSPESSFRLPGTAWPGWGWNPDTPAAEGTEAQWPPQPAASGSTFAGLSSLGYGLPYGSRAFDPDTPQSVVGPSHPAGPETVDVDSYTRQAANVSFAQRLAADPWLWDNDLVTYTDVLAQQWLGQPGAQWLNFVDPQQVRLLVDGTPQQQSEVLAHITGPDSPPILFLPVNEGNRHWSLLVVNRHTAQSFHYDSGIPPDGAPFITNTAQFQRAAQVAAVLGAGGPAGMPIPKQADGYSCGDHVLGGIEELARRVITGEFFQPDGMKLGNIRPDRQRILAVLTQAEQFGAAIFPGPPLPSGDSVHRQSHTSGGLRQDASAVLSSSGRPQRRTNKYSARTAPYPAPSSLPSGSRAVTHTGAAPVQPAHTALMGALPQGLNRAYRSCINRFLWHLEQQGRTWSQLVPTGTTDPRPAALEQVVNAGIRDHGLHASTRAALNQACGFCLQGESGIVQLAPVQPVHTALMGALPQGLSRQYRSHINRVLCHLEQQGRTWSQLVPTGATDPRPVALEQVVNVGIRDRSLHTSTRAALNEAFGFGLQGESGIVQLAPVQLAHTALMGALPQGLSKDYRSHINRFLCRLEQQDRTWSQLVPAGTTDPRPAALEQVVNAGIRDRSLHASTRAALNRAFGFGLQGESGIVQLAPVQPAHTALMGTLPQGLSRQYRSHINRFLCHLEQQGRTWSQLVPTGTTDPRPAALEQVVNVGIRDRSLHTNTRAALNRAFGFGLQGESGIVQLAPVQPVHTALMGALPQGLRQAYRSHINRFLSHLEQQGRTWSQLVPAGTTDPRPAALEQVVNAGIRDRSLHTSTRAALNEAFGFGLQGESGIVQLAPVQPVHTALMGALPQGLSKEYRSHINRFLCHLEQRDRTWSQLAPAGATDPRPAALEQVVNVGIRDRSLHTNTRAALNRAFGFGLQGESGIVQLAPVQPVHTALMGALPQGLRQAYRSHINRFLCHLEQQGRTWSQLVPAGATDPRPAALEQVVNAGIRDQSLHTSTRAALNEAFGFGLQGESGIVQLAPVQPVHTALMGALPQGLSRQYRSHINRFLCHLEQQGRTWSQLVPTGTTDPRPAALEQVVNAGIRDQSIHTSTRAALNEAFGFGLQGESGIHA
ncbi:Ulp1 family isopeptidase [Paraburkholderia youngii]|uniref:Ulp1 family isopeptidase n=1 Tax=Paraburkholderia youngii TaxID=2782701 RepID=UPI003D1D588B